MNERMKEVCRSLRTKRKRNGAGTLGVPSSYHYTIQYTLDFLVPVVDLNRIIKEGPAFEVVLAYSVVRNP